MSDPKQQVVELKAQCQELRMQVLADVGQYQTAHDELAKARATIAAQDNLIAQLRAQIGLVGIGMSDKCGIAE